jgi:hypothetical protein
MTTKPIHPSLIPHIPQTYKAEIHTHNGWFYRYSVQRTIGIFIPENSVSQHRTLRSARRACDRWTSRTSTHQLIETMSDGHTPPASQADPQDPNADQA